MKRLFPLLQAAAILLCIAGCTKKPGGPEVASSPEPIVDLVRFFADYSDIDSLDRLIFEDENEEILAAYMQVVAGTDSVCDSLYAVWAASPAVRMFSPAVDTVFSSMGPLEASLGYILAAADTFDLYLPPRTYAAVVYGRPESMLFVDSTLLVALNHYLGSDFEGYTHLPAYRRESKTPQRLPYDLAEALVATQYPYGGEPEQQTLLSAMLYNGALTYAATKLVPDADAAIALGYTADDWRYLNEHEAEIWKTMVSRGLLYEVSPSLNERFVGAAPAVRIDGLEWPARVGRFIGYKIVLNYLDNEPSASLEQLLSPAFYLSQNALAVARYNP